MSAIRLLCTAAAVFVLFAFLAEVAHACERWHDDGVALWCCPAKAGACSLVAFIGEGVPA